MLDLLKKDAYYSHIVMTLLNVSSLGFPFFLLSKRTVTGCWKSASNILVLIF